MSMSHFSKNILLIASISLLLTSLKAQTIYLYGNLNTNDVSILKEICNTLIKENKKPLKLLKIEILNSDLKQDRKYEKVNYNTIDNIIKEVYSILKSTKPEENKFNSKINSIANKQGLIIIEKPADENPLKLSKSQKIKNLKIAINFYKKPVSIISTNIKNKQEFTTPIKNIKIDIDNNQEADIKSIIYKTNNSKIYSTENILYINGNNAISFQLSKNNSRPFNLNIAIVTEENDTSDFYSLKDLRFVNAENEFNAELYGITPVTPAILRCKKQISENQGSLRYLFKILMNKDFDINQLIINIKILDKYGTSQDYQYPLRKLTIYDYSVRNYNNESNIVCIYIDPLKFGFANNCASDPTEYKEYRYRISISNDPEYLSVFEPNKIRSIELNSFCQGFDGSTEEFLVLPLCNCD